MITSMSSPVHASGSRPAARSPLPTAHSLLHPPLSVLVDDTSGFTHRQRSSLTNLSSRYTTAMDYTAQRPPPANWLKRHADTPAIFRDTMASTVYWSDEQRNAIRAAFSGWRDDDHPFHSLLGYTLPAATRIAQSRQDAAGALHVRQNHTLRYWINHTRQRTDAQRDGIILYGVRISEQPSAAPFLHGPALLNPTQHDLYTHSAAGTDLSILVGQQHTYTALHIDHGDESVWQLLLEGQKLWVVGRPERASEMYAALPSERTVAWKRDTDGVEAWVVDQRTMVIVQNAGDIVYLPRGWPHVVRHYSDTLAISCSMLHAWDFADALRDQHFTALSASEYALYQSAMEALRTTASLQSMLMASMTDVEQLWRTRTAARVAAEQARAETRMEAPVAGATERAAEVVEEERREGGKRARTG